MKQYIKKQNQLSTTDICEIHDENDGNVEESKNQLSVEATSSRREVKFSNILLLADV